jgi:hypothetical protein
MAAMLECFHGQNITLKVETFGAAIYVGITAQDRSAGKLIT